MNKRVNFRISDADHIVIFFSKEFFVSKHLNRKTSFNIQRNVVMFILIFKVIGSLDKINHFFFEHWFLNWLPKEYKVIMR